MVIGYINMLNAFQMHHLRLVLFVLHFSVPVSVAFSFPFPFPLPVWSLEFGVVVVVGVGGENAFYDSIWCT